MIGRVRNGKRPESKAVSVHGWIIRERRGRGWRGGPFIRRKGHYSDTPPGYDDSPVADAVVALGIIYGRE